MNKSDMLSIGRPVPVPISDDGKPLDYHKEMDAGEMIKHVSYERIIKAIMNMETNFVFNHIKMDINEVEKNKLFKVRYYYIPGDLTRFVEDDVHVEDELEGRTWHRMSKEPHNVIAIMIARREEGSDDWSCSYITEYSRKSNGEVVLRLLVKLIDIFMEWKDIKTLRKMLDYVEESEKIAFAHQEFKRRFRPRKED